MSYMNQHIVAHWGMSEHGIVQDIAYPGEYLKRGLIAHYLLNDNAASTDIADSIGDHDGTSTQNSSVMSVAGKINTAIDFNGTSDEIEIPSDGDWSPGLGDWGISAWVKTSGAGTGAETHDRIISCQIAGRYWYLGITREDGYSRGGWNDGLGGWHGNGATDLYDGAWHNIVASFIRGDGILTIKMYLDGELESTQSSTYGAGTVSLAGAEVYIGSGGSDYFFDGSVDDVRIYNRAPSASEASALYNGGNGTEAYGRHHGTTTGIDSTNLVTTPYGGIGTQFNGTDEDVNFSTGTFNAVMSGISSYSFSCLLSYDSINANQYDNIFFASFVNSSSSSVYLNIRGDGANAGKVQIGGRGSAGDAFQSMTSAGALSQGRTYHIVAVFNYAEDTINIIIDGVPETPTAVTFAESVYTPGTPTRADVIGYDNSGTASRHFAGILDEIQIFSKELTVIQANDLRKRITL